MRRPHLLVLLLFCPVGPHVAAIDARQHHRATDQNHVHRLLPVPVALLLATYEPDHQSLFQMGLTNGAEPLQIVLTEVLRCVLRT